MSTKEKGDASEAVVIAELVKRKIPTLIPFGDNQSYDLVAEINGMFVRIQIKTGRLRSGAVRFKPRSVVSRKGGPVVYRGYAGRADVFMVWCPDLPLDVFVVPVASVRLSEVCLRTIPTRNGQSAGCRYASEYQIDRWLETLGPGGH